MNNLMSYYLVTVPNSIKSSYGEMNKEEASMFFEWINKNAENRINEISSFIRSTNEDFVLDFSPESLLPLGYWLKTALRTRCRTKTEERQLVENVPNWVKESILEDRQVFTEESMNSFPLLSQQVKISS